MRHVALSPKSNRLESIEQEVIKIAREFSDMTRGFQLPTKGLMDKGFELCDVFNKLDEIIDEDSVQPVIL